MDTWGKRGHLVQMPQVLSVPGLFEKQQGGQCSCGRVDEGESVIR